MGRLMCVLWLMLTMRKVHDGIQVLVAIVRSHVGQSLSWDVKHAGRDCIYQDSMNDGCVMQVCPVIIVNLGRLPQDPYTKSVRQRHRS